jgi:MoaA/NifB/PqqE/SkfB family radical SAM enzyme
MNPIPTKRFVLEPSLSCNIVCQFCYHLHRVDTWKETTKSFDEVKNIIDAGKARGNNYMDITGGEPTQYEHIVETVEYAKSIGVDTCIISNGIIAPRKIKQLIDAGLDDWLISRHGLRDVHNQITNCPHAYDQQIKSLNQISEEMNFRFNSVITKYNQEDLPAIAREMALYPATIVNFINFNPLHEWVNDSLKATEIVADMNKVKLEPAIEILENSGITVNVRYFPMCRLTEHYRRCVCNDLHVVFDPYEWDYEIQPKTFEEFRDWGIRTSKSNEEQGEPCNSCDLHKICGGINSKFRHYHISEYDEPCLPQKLNPDQIDYEDFYFYRREQQL